MTRGIYSACVDELSKIAVKLSPSEERGQLLRFGAMGAGAVPLISGLANTMQHGRPWAHGTNLKRWLPAQMLTGALFGGVLPTARHRIERSMQTQAKDRMDVQRMMQQAGMNTMPKAASSPGQDLRMPLTGGTKMPTDDSKTFANKLLSQSKSSAEVGPVASAKKLPGSSVRVRDFIPKFGADMSDPLIDYLKKQAAEKKLEDNEKDQRKGEAVAETKPQVELTSDDSDHEFEGGVSQYHSAVKKLFTNAEARTAKHTGKDFPSGVQKVLDKEQRNATAKSSHQP